MRAHSAPGVFFFFKQKTAYEIPKRDWSSDVCSSDLCPRNRPQPVGEPIEIPILTFGGRWANNCARRRSGRDDTLDRALEREEKGLAKWERDIQYASNHSCGWLCHAALSVNSDSAQAIAPGCGQADDRSRAGQPCANGRDRARLYCHQRQIRRAVSELGR